MYTEARNYRSVKLSVPLTSVNFAIHVFTFVLPIARVAKLRLMAHWMVGAYISLMAEIASCVWILKQV